MDYRYFPTSTGLKRLLIISLTFIITVITLYLIYKIYDITINTRYIVNIVFSDDRLLKIILDNKKH